MAASDPAKKLARSIDEEIKFAKESAVLEQNELPKELRSFLDKSKFTLVASPRQSEIQLVKDLGTEKITCIIDMDQIYDRLANEEFEEENAEESAEDNEEEDIEGFDGSCENDLQMQVKIEKDVGGVKNLFEAKLGLAEEYMDIHSLKITKAGVASSFEGPDMSMLDPDLLENIQSYLQSKGINQDLLEFSNEFLDLKENSEYLHWLNDLKSFVSQ